MATPIVMPRLGDFMTEGVVTRFTKSTGAEVAQGEVIAEIETEKVNYDLEATNAGYFHPIVDEGSTVAVDDIMGYLLAEGEKAPEKSGDTDTIPKSSRRNSRRDKRAGSNLPRVDGNVPSTPGARKLAAKMGVPLDKVVPSGPRGRIVEADVRGYVEVSSTSETVNVLAGLPEPSETIALTGIRKSIASHMKGSLENSAQLSYFLEVDITEAQKLRREVGVGIGDLLIKSCAEALQRVPKLNSVLHDGVISTFEQVNLAIAVALDDGLIVPVLRDVGSKNLLEISAAVKDISKKARTGELGPDELVGGTFTISILGSVDGFTPILNQSQVALLGVGRSVQKPVVKDKEIAIREMMTLSLTGDHQVIDGAVAANFFRRLQQIVENPSRLISQ